MRYTDFLGTADIRSGKDRDPVPDFKSSVPKKSELLQ